MRIKKLKIKFKHLAFTSLTILTGCFGGGDQTKLAYNALGRGHHLNLITDGYVIGIEKYRRESMGGPVPGSYNRFDKKPNPDNDELVSEQNEEYENTTDDPKSMVITHITSYFPNRDYLYNAYSADLNGTIDYEQGFEGLVTFQQDLQRRIAEAKAQGNPYSHLFIMSMGWNNDQFVSVYRYNRVIENILQIIHQQQDTEFKPLIIGITWPSAWFSIEDSWIKKKVIGHLGSYTNKSNDADEIGYTIMNWVINHQIPGVRQEVGDEDFPQIVAVGHSMGARILSRAIFSRDHLKSSTINDISNVDMFIGLQGAFSARRFIERDSGEGAPYKDYASLPTLIVLTSSENDKANPTAFWSKHVGGKNGLEYMREKTKTFSVFDWPEEQKQIADAIRNYKPNGRIITLDVKSIVTGDDAHNDILDADMAKLIIFCLDQLKRGDVH